ncbi:hypothetical protein UFOVP597_35 [uncultured Caudovirales phage]|uniref:DUF6291 domain-containing protein n=1 Tax=uncultured Caudovirales phage TaxID=2100421 RepID=A0A6J5MZ08_9CAUD|nr:hypothetical protein UFOVP597_35 [uncultured Caudovirales phage]
MENKRDSMVFYRSFYESLKGLSPIICAEVYDAIFSYGLDFKDSDFSEPVAKALFTLIKPQLDANIKRYENGSKPKNKQIISENKQTESKMVSNDNVNDNDNDNINENNNLLLKKESKPKKSIDDRKLEFRDKVHEIMIVEDIDKIIVKDFFNYWTEPNQAKTKLRFEMEKTWDISRRLSTWVKNNDKFSVNKKVGNYAPETRTDSQNSAKEQFRRNFNQ